LKFLSESDLKIVRVGALFFFARLLFATDGAHSISLINELIVVFHDQVLAHLVRFLFDLCGSTVPQSLSLLEEGWLRALAVYEGANLV